MDDMHEEVALRNGGTATRQMVAVLMLSLRTLVEEAKKPGDQAISYLLSLYDLLELCKDASYHRHCFGPNRQKLLDSALVSGGTTGPLTVHDITRAVVLSALSFDMTSMSVNLRDPIDS